MWPPYLSHYVFFCATLPHGFFEPATSGLPTCCIRSCHLIAVLKVFPTTHNSYVPHVVFLPATCGRLIFHICYCDYLIALAKSSDLPHVVLLLTHLAFIPTTWYLLLCHMWSSNLPQVVVFNICHIWICHIIAVPMVFLPPTCSLLTCHMWSSDLPHDVFSCAT